MRNTEENRQIIDRQSDVLTKTNDKLQFGVCMQNMENMEERRG